MRSLGALSGAWNRPWSAGPREVLLRVLLFAAYIQMGTMSPFIRYIHPDEMWLYRSPRKDPYVNGLCLWSIAALTPLTLALIHFIIKRDKEDFVQITLAVTLSLGLNCFLTDMVKLIVGRPRPDFFWRCFPDGEMNSDMQCTGSLRDVTEGRKSFPSGHSSISFSSLGMMAWWLMGKLHIWSTCRGSSWRLFLSFLPLVMALLVALSRLCDYHHHWQDITVGSLLGLSISFMCYRQYFPPLNSQHSHRPYSASRQSISIINRRESTYSTSDTSCLSCQAAPFDSNSELCDEGDLKPDEKSEEKPLVNGQLKWI